jgi:energy-coupling factor transport system ATP-binding protein
MLKVTDLTFTYPKQLFAVLNKINFYVQKGESLAILGSNGSGKTTLGYCLCGIIPKLINGRMDGQVIIYDKNTIDYSLHELFSDSGFIFQDPDSQFVTLRVRDELLLGIENLNIPRDEINKRLSEVIKYFNLEDLLNKSPKDLSMGQKQKVAIASIIAMGPKLLILDEPASTLDPKERNNFFNILNDLKKKGLTIIFITNNFDDVKAIAKRILVIHEGSISLDGKPEMVNSKEILQFFNVDNNIVYEKNLNIGKIKICVENLSYKYPNSKEFAIKDVSFTVNHGEILGVVGPNGSGKSTLLLLMNNLIKANSGQVLIDGENIKELDFHKIARKQGIVFQNPNYQIFASSIKEELSFGLNNIGCDQKEIEMRIKAVSDFVNFKDTTKDPNSLSFGWRKLLAMASVIIMDPEIILIDEPELGMDIGYIKRFEILLSKLNKFGKTFVIASHNLDLIERLTHRIIFLEKGKQVQEGKTEEIIGGIRDYFGR